jgi:hypothetical protein
MKYLAVTALLLAMITVGHSSFAQKNLKATKPVNKTTNVHSNASRPVVGDTLAYNVKKLFAKLSTMACNDNIPVEAFFSSYSGRDASGRHTYVSSVIAPNSIENKVQRVKVDWETGVAEWVWTSTLLRYPQYQEPEQTFLSLRDRIVKIIYGLPKTDATDPKNKVISFFAEQNITDVMTRKSNPNDYDELVLEFRFVKPFRQTQQKYVDSIASMYRPGFNSLETAADAWRKFSDAIINEGFAEEKIEDIFATEIKSAADKDIKLAYTMYYAIGFRHANNALTKLNADQVTKIVNMGNALLDSYSKGQKFDIKTYDPNPPVQTYSPYSGSSSSSRSVFDNPAPQGEKTRCAVCDGTGLMDQVEYSHTYNGISGNYTTTVIKKVRCTFCNGTGWVIKEKKRRRG